MPKLSQYLASEEGIQPPASEDWPLGRGEGAAVKPPKDSASAQHEIEALKNRLARRIQDHGPRVYRHPDGSLKPQPPPGNPHTIANRRRWSKVVQHCRHLEGVEAQLARTGVSARYYINSSWSEHAAALAAIGLVPEVDESGSWVGYIPGYENPLEEQEQVMATPELREVVHQMLERAESIHGEGMVQEAGLQRLAQLSRGYVLV